MSVRGADRPTVRDRNIDGLNPPLQKLPATKNPCLSSYLRYTLPTGEDTG